MNQITRIFHSFEGNWKLHRTISGQGYVTGSARFVKSSINSLDYREEGIFHADLGKEFRVFREYLYRLENDEISVFFAENPPRLMHTLEFGPSNFKSAKAIHKCDCDIYDGLYQFRFPKSFSLSYSVKGPKKNYSINTVFERSIN